MATITATTLFKSWKRRSTGSAGITKEAPTGHSRVFDRIREILGYDLREQVPSRRVSGRPWWCPATSATSMAPW